MTTKSAYSLLGDWGMYYSFSFNIKSLLNYAVNARAECQQIISFLNKRHFCQFKKINYFYHENKTLLEYF